MTRIVDLSYPIHEGMTTYPADYHARVEVTQLARHGIEGRETRRITLGTHTGTHIDAPKHFLPDGQGVDAIGLDVLCGDAFVVDCVGGHARTSLPASYPSRILLRFGWSSRFKGAGFYDSYPVITLDLATAMVDSGVRLLGMDTPSPDRPDESSIHRYLLSEGVVLLEYLNNLDQLKPGKLELYCLPLNITGADGAPARVVAVQ